MNDFNQSEQLHFEFSDYPEMPNPLGQMISQRQPTVIKDGAFDPHQLMVKKKLTDAGAIDTTPTQSWPEKDIKSLEDFCMKYGIVGYNCGRMSPIAALAMLKQKLGILDTAVVERTPYSDIMNKKVLLKG